MRYYIRVADAGLNKTVRSLICAPYLARDSDNHQKLVGIVTVVLGAW